MRVQNTISSCPVGLLSECTQIEAASERKHEIIDHAIRVRERHRVSNRQIRNLLTLHPLHTTKVILIAGLLTFIFAFLLSELAAFGKWYLQLKGYHVDVPVPLVGTESLSLGGYVPTSTELTYASKIPTFSIMTSVYIALGVMMIILLERVIVAALHIKDAHALRSADDEMSRELATLHEWKRNG